eukprot:552824-Rhodomonas_salina.2
MRKGRGKREEGRGREGGGRESDADRVCIVRRGVEGREGVARVQPACACAHTRVREHTRVCIHAFNPTTPLSSVLRTARSRHTTTLVVLMGIPCAASPLAPWACVSRVLVLVLVLVHVCACMHTSVHTRLHGACA